ncbi:MAG: methylmalonyl Co-A mutase-associated GTPase MeaB [Chitinophagales bacterium]|jgi:LAO/AO transport system kinase|nr:methylmalonyl Co-A mutase-associated GTPase MeaB [Sphingobacteriales bacterium]
MQSLEEGVLQGNIAALARMITYNESTRLEDNLIADNFINKNQEKLSNSIVLSISGIPGVGKSSFIETLGVYLHHLGYKLAVFSIDPSSELSHGSILGDKTRMTELSSMDNVFIRPSPSSNRLGGLGINTHKNIELAKIAGYDIILVETVGVGQSETIVKNLCDAFILLLMPASGDELQVIKKGIMEVADFYIIHKADGELLNAANLSKKEIENSVHLLKSDLNVSESIFAFSSIEKLGLDLIWNFIMKFIESKKEKKTFYSTRILQRIHWFKETYERMMLMHYLEKGKEKYKVLEDEIKAGKYISLNEIKENIEE